MASTATTIEWTDVTWNPVSGCRKVSPGCAHCYAETMARRQMGPWKGRAFEDVRLHPDRLDAPLRWRKPKRVFVNSMSDLFHEDVPDEFIDRVFATMALAKQHTFQVLTKRPKRMQAFCSGPMMSDWPGGLPNVWLGVSAEDQQRADERIPILLDTPAAVRFVSAEPLLGPIEFSASCVAPFSGFPDEVNGGLHWIIVGGESGPGARPCDVDWIRDIVRQCREAGVACFVKQLGAYPALIHGDAMATWLRDWNPTVEPVGPEAAAHFRVALRAQKGGDPAEWPSDLRVREFPQPHSP